MTRAVNAVQTLQWNDNGFHANSLCWSERCFAVCQGFVEQVSDVLVIDAAKFAYPPDGWRQSAQVAQHAQLMGNGSLVGLGALRQVRHTDFPPAAPPGFSGGSGRPGL